MKKSQRYDTSYLIEDQYEPGSRGRVLRNKLGIKSSREMNRIEKEAQLLAIDKLTDIFAVDHRFTVRDVTKL